MAFNAWTVQQLADAFHLSKRSIHAYLKANDDGLIYTCSWEDHSPGPPSRQWIMGMASTFHRPPAQDVGAAAAGRAARGQGAEAMLKRNRRRLNKLKNRVSLPPPF